jgi:hypothetical protein
MAAPLSSCPSGPKRSSHSNLFLQIHAMAMARFTKATGLPF